MSATIPRPTSPQGTAKLAGIFYLGTIISGALALALPGGGTVMLLISTACYVVVTLLFYTLFRPVSPAVSLLALIVGLVGCLFGALGPLHLSPISVSPLLFFGFYCLLIGFLIFRSEFLPRWLGVFMAMGGLGWLTVVTPALAARLSPYNMATSVLAETSLTVWLVVRGVSSQRWHEQARARGLSAA